MFICFLHPHTVISCGDPGNVPNAFKSGGYNYNEDVTYTCLDGYNLIGNNPITCKGDKTWSGSPPLCDSMYTNFVICEIQIKYW